MDSRLPRGQPAPRFAAVSAALRRRSSARRPIAAHSEPAIAAIAAHLEAGPCVLDLGCGTGESTRAAASADPDTTFLGIDRSALRLQRGRALAGPPNAVLLRAEIDDVLAVAARRGWRFAAVWSLYPNPWPKPGHLGRRFYARGCLRDVAAITNRFESRTNWEVFALELHHALRTLHASVTLESGVEGPWTPTTAFERKYVRSGHALWRIRARFDHGPARAHTRSPFARKIASNRESSSTSE